jgi:tripartite-type tricarboxylate transporter receptor subunit TctC
MIAWARANPGKLTVASNGEGGFPHLIFEQLRMMAGFSFNHIPYKGSAQIATELMGGQVMAGVDGVTGLTPHIKSGRINLLAVTSKARTPQWPDTPAAAEAVPGYESGGWFGWVGPAGMPREIVVRLNEEINRAMKHPDVVEKLTSAGLSMVYESPDYFAELIRSEYAKYGKLVKAIGFKPQ